MKKKILQITGGFLKRRKIVFYDDNKVRPATSKVREAIFNILYDKVEDANVLDLFAGSGSVGVEALSRGANFCVFVDNNKNILNMIKQNIALLELEQKAYFFLLDIIKSLSVLKRYNDKFDIVFIDPPYNKNYIVPSLMNLKKLNILNEKAFLIIEHSDKEVVPENIFKFYKTKKYGETTLTFLINES